MSVFRLFASISACVVASLICACAGPGQKPPIKQTASTIDQAATTKLKKPRKIFPYRMGGDWAGGGAVTEEIDRGTRKKIESALARQESVLAMYDPTGLTPKVVREDLELLQKPEADCIIDLDIGDNELSDEDIEPLSKLSLQILRARENELHDLHALAKMKSLRSLDVGGCEINQQGLNVVQSLPRLTYLCLDLTNFKGLDVSGLGQLKNLKTLRLLDCTGITKDTLDKLKAALPACKIDFTPGMDETHADLLDLRHIEMSLIAGGDYAHADLAISGLIDKWKVESNPPYAAIAEGYRLRGECQEKLTNLSRAAEMFSTARDVYLTQLPDGDGLPAVALSLAGVLEELNKPAESRAERVRADQFWRKHKPIKRLNKLYKSNCKWLSKHKQ